VHQVANLHVVIDLSGCQLTQKSCELVGNPGCQPGLATSLQLVRLVGCSLYCKDLTDRIGSKNHFLSLVLSNTDYSKSVVFTKAVRNHMVRPCVE